MMGKTTKRKMEMNTYCFCFPADGIKRCQEGYIAWLIANLRNPDESPSTASSVMLGYLTVDRSRSVTAHTSALCVGKRDWRLDHSKRNEDSGAL